MLLEFLIWKLLSNIIRSDRVKILKKIFIVILLLTLVLKIGFHINGDDLTYNTLSRDYFVENAAGETSSNNIVTAIYLDYRLFDSFFEASILLVAVTGIAFMAIKDEDLY